MERRRFIDVAGTAGIAIATSFAGCLGLDDSGDDEDGQSQSETADENGGSQSETDEHEQDAERLEPVASVPIDDHDQAAETNVEQLLITLSEGDLDPQEHVVEMDYFVQNSAPDRRTATLVSTLDVDDGGTYEERRAVSVPGETVNEYVLPHAIEESTSADGFSYGFSATLEW